MVWVLSLKQKIFWFVLMFFWGWNIKVWCATRLCSWTTPFFTIHKWSCPFIIRSWLLFACGNTCISYQHENVKKIENVLNKEFSSLCQWFIGNMLSIHFGEDKTKSIFFSKARGLRKLIYPLRAIPLSNKKQ